MQDQAVVLSAQLGKQILTLEVLLLLIAKLAELEVGQMQEQLHVPLALQELPILTPEVQLHLLV